MMREGRNMSEYLKSGSEGKGISSAMDDAVEGYFSRRGGSRESEKYFRISNRARKRKTGI